MSTSSAHPREYSFGEFTLDVDRGALLSGSADIKLRPKSFELLRYLVQQHGRLVSRDELLDAIWADTVVTQDAVTQCLIDVRKAIGDKSQKMIRTVPKRGYIFDLPVTEHGGPTATADAPKDSVLGPQRPGWRIGAALAGLIGIAAISLYFVVADRTTEDRHPGTDEQASEEATMPGGRIRLAVLPLDNFSGDPDQEYFSDGLTEELIAQLAGLRSDRLGVIARTSVMYYKDKNKRIDEIGRELSLDYVLEGSVRRADDRVRVTAQLIKVDDQTHVWVQSFERDLQDILVLQSEIAQRVTRSLALELLPTMQARLEQTQAVNPRAYEAYLRGRHFEGILVTRRAAEHYSIPIREDPEYAPAFAALGRVYRWRGAQAVIPNDEANQMAWKYSLRAAELDPGLAEVEVNLADLKFYVDWEWAEGEAGFRRAYEKNPASESVVRKYAWCLLHLGRYDEAISVLERALELDPHSLFLIQALLVTYVDAREYERALQLARRTTESEPKRARVYGWLWDVYFETGNHDEAVAAFLKSRSLRGASDNDLRVLQATYNDDGIRAFWQKNLELMTLAGDNIPRILFAYVFARMGDSEQAVALLEQAAQSRIVPPMAFARVYAIAGDQEQALIWLERAYDERDVLLPGIKGEREFIPLRNHPRFQELLRRMNLPS